MGYFSLLQDVRRKIKMAIKSPPNDIIILPGAGFPRAQHRYTARVMIV